MDEFISIIGSYGFPIAMTCVMAYYVKYINDKHSQQIDDIMSTHKIEMDNVTSALNNNTIALTKLCERMGYDESSR